MKNYKVKNFPDSRIAGIDIGETGKQKHHISALLEIDVTNARKKIKAYNRKDEQNISFTAWLISTIAQTIAKHETAGAYRLGKSKLMIFDDVNISLAVEKNVGGEKVPIPLVIEKAQEISIASITRQIKDAKNKVITKKEMVLQKKAGKAERIYRFLPGFIRRWFWKYLLKHPKLAYKKMGNVAFTSIGMVGKINAWFLPISVHPVCFGVSSIVKKPHVVDDEIIIREILNMSVLIDHDVIDGAPMARFINELSISIEKAINI
ncbi:MAG: 2-oxo acid dehydrogenase subunit E2 [Bacteroidales bacterium]